jgi:hypothetical protein
VTYSADGGAPPPPPHVRYRSPSGEEPGVFDITPPPTAPPAAVTPLAHNRSGTAALVLGCLGLVCTGLLFLLFPIGLVLGLIAVVLGRRGRRRARYGLATNRASATAGLTLGLIAVLLGTLLSATTFWLIQRYDTGAMRDCVRNQQTFVDAGRCILDVVANS